MEETEAKAEEALRRKQRDELEMEHGDALSCQLRALKEVLAAESDEAVRSLREALTSEKDEALHARHEALTFEKEQALRALGEALAAEREAALEAAYVSLSTEREEALHAAHVALDEARLAELSALREALSAQHAADSRLALREQRLALECAASEAQHAALDQQRSLLGEEKAEELARTLSTLHEGLHAHAADELRALDEQHARAAAEAARTHAEQLLHEAALHADALKELRAALDEQQGVALQQLRAEMEDDHTDAQAALDSRLRAQRREALSLSNTTRPAPSPSRSLSPHVVAVGLQNECCTALRAGLFLFLSLFLFLTRPGRRL